MRLSKEFIKTVRKPMKKKTTRIIIHIVVWVVLLVLPVYAARKFRMGSYFLLTYYSFMAINALIFYANYLFLVPGLFLKKRRYSYYLAVLALIIGFYFISDLVNNRISDYIYNDTFSEQLNISPVEGQRPGPPAQGMRRRFINLPHAQLIGYTSSSVFMVLLSLGLRVLERQSEIEKMQEEMDKAKLNAELAFLKNQISPHFFFNTLNNIYSLIGKSTEDSRKAVSRLSKLMRYVLEGSEHDYKHLSEELEFMNNYIDIMRMRIGEKTKLIVDFPEEYKDISIPPLLFISLIENAFKYGVSVQEESNISISLECGEKSISFTSLNSLPGRTSVEVQESSGIGIENLKKRLKLLYPGRHELKLNKTETIFAAYLTIHLNE